MEDKEYLEEAKERKEEDRAVSEEAEKKPAKDDDEYEKICYVCRRPESKTGPMVTMGGMNLCHDCMQRTFDSMNGTGFPMGDMMNMGSFNNMNLDKMPNISMINLSDLQNMMGGMPNSQKIRKKKPNDRPSAAVHWRSASCGS